MESRFIFKNGAISSLTESPPVTSLLETYPGAYTTTRTHKNGSLLLFWERHMTRLSNSLNLLFVQNPNLLFQKPKNDVIPAFSKEWSQKIMWDSVVSSLVNESMEKVVPFAVKGRESEEEWAITILLSGNLHKENKLELLVSEAEISQFLDVYVHLGRYSPPTFGVSENSARLAVVGHGREFANAKYSDWVKLRRPLEKLRPPSVTELLLSNDGDHILEGCLTNFFVICLKEKEGSDYLPEQDSFDDYLRCVEVQSAPVHDGVLPGVIRQVIKEICSKIGLSFREVSPSWSKRELWVEAFITNSLRILQPVETVQAPDTWDLKSSWKEVSWVEKPFEVVPGRITAMLQGEIMNAANVESLSVASFVES